MTDADCVAFLQWALPGLGMRWEGFRKVRRQVCRRVERRLRELDVAGIAGYRAFLEATPEEWSRLDDLCHITISRFYRDKGVFDFLRRVVLPTLGRDAQARGAAVEIWSAGCASGEEAYTLALIWHLAVRPGLPEATLHILATDADETMLRRAGAAAYPQSALRDLPGDWRGTGFTREGDDYRLRAEFRQPVTLLRHDVREPPPGGPFDLVLCRNVAFTYFDLHHQRRVAAQLARCIRPGGALVIGAHETLPEDAKDLEPWSATLRVFRRLSGSGESRRAIRGSPDATIEAGEETRSSDLAKRRAR